MVELLKRLRKLRYYQIICRGGFTDALYLIWTGELTS